MFVTAVCFLFLLKLKWPKNKNFYDVTQEHPGTPEQPGTAEKKAGTANLTVLFCFLITDLVKNKMSM